MTTYLSAVCDEDLLDAASDALVDAGWALDEDLELPFESELEDESDWWGVQVDAVCRLWDRLTPEERVELWLQDCGGAEPEDPVDAETIWERMAMAVIERLGAPYDDAGYVVQEACIRALHLTSAPALARTLTLYETERVERDSQWGRPSQARTFDVEHGTVVARSEDGNVVARLRPAFADGDDDDAVIVEMLGDAFAEVGLV